MADWNPRYLAYCRATGNLTPEATLERDSEQYPGGCMCGFLSWHTAKIAEAKKLHPEFFYIGFAGIDGLLDHAGYDKWLRSVTNG